MAWHHGTSECTSTTLEGAVGLRPCRARRAKRLTSFMHNTRAHGRSTSCSLPKRNRFSGDISSAHPSLEEKRSRARDGPCCNPSKRVWPTTVTITPPCHGERQRQRQRQRHRLRSPVAQDTWRDASLPDGAVQGPGVLVSPQTNRRGKECIASLQKRNDRPPFALGGKCFWSQ